MELLLTFNAVFLAISILFFIYLVCVCPDIVQINTKVDSIKLTVDLIKAKQDKVYKD